MIYKILSLIFLFSLCCLNCGNPSGSDSIFSYEMFYLRDSTISYSAVENIPLELLVLQKIPFMTAEDIHKYTVNFLDNNPIQSYHISLKDSSNGNFSNAVRPFVLVINGRRFSLAEYWPSFMSIIPKSITMYKAFGNFYHLHPGDDVGNTKLKDPIIVTTLKMLDIEIEYVNIGE